MLRVTLRGVVARKLRLLLASLAVLLGVSFVSGTYVLTDTMKHVFDNLFSDLNQGVSVIVQGKSAVEGGVEDGPQFVPIPESLLPRVEKVDGVAQASGDVGDLATLVVDGKPEKGFGPPTFGFGFDPSSPLDSYELKRGRAPKGLHEVAIDPLTAERNELEIGDTIGVIGRVPQVQATITGFLGLKTTDQQAGARLLGFEPAAAKQLFGVPGTYVTIRVAADEGVSAEQLRDRIAAAVPDAGIEVQTADENAQEQADQIKEGLGFFTIALSVFAYIALFVGMFLIFNTFSMLVAQRTRELALLRALGASRGQVTRSVLVEAVTVGLVASLVGFVTGIGVAAGLRSVLGALGLELPRGSIVVLPRTLWLCLAVGLGVTVVAALVPARRAARVAPVQAMRESGPAEERSLARRTALGSVVTLLGVVLILRGLSSSATSVGLGAAVTFLGVTVLSPLFARAVVRVLGAPLARLGTPGRLGRGNAMRSPRRTSATAAALMIGLALVAAISTLGASAKASTVAVVSRSLGADYVLRINPFGYLSPEVEQRAAKVPGVAGVAAFRSFDAELDGEKSGGQAVDPTSLREALDLDVLSGDLSLRKDTVALARDKADDLNVEVGDQLKVVWEKGDGPPLTVSGIYDLNDFAGGVLVSTETFLPHNTDRGPFIVAVQRDPGASEASVRTGLETALKGFPNVDIEDQEDFASSTGDQIDTLLNVITVLLVFSVLIALLGVVNTLGLSVVERTRELGLLRAVGLRRRQMALMVCSESVVISVYGAVLGAVVGTGFGYAIVRSLEDEGITEFRVPVLRVVLIVVLTAFGGVVASVLPAVRAARLKVLDAIAHV